MNYNKKLDWLKDYMNGWIDNWQPLFLLFKKYEESGILTVCMSRNYSFEEYCDMRSKYEEFKKQFPEL